MVKEKRPLLIKTANKKATELLDELLWSSPAQGFLPHESSINAGNSSLIFISDEDPPLPLYHHCINSTPNAILNTCFLKVYDFEEFYTEERAHLSALRLKAYKEANFAIASF